MSLMNFHCPWHLCAETAVTVRRGGRWSIVTWNDVNELREKTGWDWNARAVVRWNQVPGVGWGQCCQHRKRESCSCAVTSVILDNITTVSLAYVESQHHEVAKSAVACHIPELSLTFYNSSLAVWNIICHTWWCSVRVETKISIVSWITL